MLTSSLKGAPEGAPIQTLGSRVFRHPVNRAPAASRFFGRVRSSMCCRNCQGNLHRRAMQAGTATRRGEQRVTDRGCPLGMGHARAGRRNRVEGVTLTVRILSPQPAMAGGTKPRRLGPWLASVAQPWRATSSVGRRWERVKDKAVKVADEGGVYLVTKVPCSPNGNERVPERR